MTATEYSRIPKGQLQDIPTFADSIMKRMAAKEDEFYKEVMRQRLNREPTIDDYKDVTLAVHINYPDQELIAYKGQPFGRIIKGYKTDDPLTFAWTFEPNPTFKKDATI